MKGEMDGNYRRDDGRKMLVDGENILENTRRC